MQGDRFSNGLYSFGLRSCCILDHVEGLSGVTRVLRWERVIILVAEVGLVPDVNAER